MLSYTIYQNPRDYPGRVVLRAFFVGDQHRTVRDPEPEPEPRYVGDSVDQARQLIPDDCICLGRAPEDEPQIVESWL